MRRFFVRPEDVGERQLRLRGDEAQHLTRVLRLRPGAQVVVFNGHGHEYVAEVERLEADGVVCRILCQTEAPPPEAVFITLGQGLPKAEKFAWVIQKTTELGVSEIVPLLTERVISQLSEGHIAAKLGRWEKLAREACKQSGRVTVPHLRPPTPLETFFASCQSAGLKLVLWEGEPTRPLRDVLAASEPVASVAVVVGPEGGLTPQEVACGAAYGFLPVGLGKRILRTETAGLLAVALLQYRF
ncbi:MAG TPA: 16S rRNA (uracil(1498)-N(3))-methyltransferase, partial [Candidatus Tectomicrobia bacterium]|nr:16S rRNA (uracil(1498)-N(3))-methyltransferase [Candidatus Tectomicrobia bacterium]